MLCKSISLVASPSLPQRTSEIQGGRDVQISTGDGPEQATLQRIIQILLEDQTSWVATQDSTGWARPIFTPALSPKHQARWKTTGTFILLHLLTLGNGPEPVSPFLVYLLLKAASLTGAQPLCAHDALISLGSLYQLDSEAANMLRPWMVLKESDNPSEFATNQVPHPIMLLQSVLGQCEFQVCHFPKSPPVVFKSRT